jgi:hypothetical protein
LIEHREGVECRLGRLERIELGDAADRQAKAFFDERLKPAWRAAADRFVRDAECAGLNLREPLPHSQQCLSPSDFGFHNALLAADDRLRFFDFEYAGWDDPAKLASDFFCQPELPVDEAEWDCFLGGLAARLGGDSGMSTRARLILPVCRLKWCCIVLNEFVCSGQRRRAHARGSGPTLERKLCQIEKAERMLAGAGRLTSCRAGD